MSTPPRTHRISAPAKTALTALVSLSLMAAAAATPAFAADSTDKSYLVTSTTGTIASHTTQIADAGATITDTYPALKTVDVAMTSAEAAALASQPGVKVELDKAITATDTITAPTWGLDRIDQPTLPLDTNYTWPAAETGTGVTAYVIDSGIYAANVQFGSRVATGYTNIIDGQGTNDCNGHGTHVAGTIGGSTVGVAHNVTLVPVRVLDCAAAGTVSGVVDGINWVITNHQAGVPAVANLSLGAGQSAALDAAVTALIADGVTVTVAAGNSNVDACTASPSDVPGALTVAATGNTDARASYSDFGPCVDLFAPGGSGTLNDLIISAGISSPTALAGKAGTSMSSPFVAGMAARYLSRYPGATPAAVNAAILASASSNIVTDPGLGTPNKLLFAGPLGFGSAPVLSAPSAPATATAVGGPGSVSVTWTAPTSNGNSPITGYSVSLLSGTTSAAPVALPSTATTYTFNSLTAGAVFSVKVSAVNAIGTGAAATTAAVTVAAPLPATLPAAPDSVTATVGVATSTVTWVAPTNTGNTAITGYTVKVINATTKAAMVSTSASANLRSITFSGLASGTQIYATVAATNVKGTGPVATSPSLTVVGLPAAPSGLTATATLGAATFAWTAPANTGGVSLTGYTLVVKNSATGAVVTTLSTLATTTSTSIPLPGGAAYTATVTAANTVGASPASNAVTVTPATLPAAVTALKATFPSTLKAAITWTAPTSLGGTPLVRYEYRVSTVIDGVTPTTWTAWSTTGTLTSVTVSGTVKGTTRLVEVRAVTVAGTGASAQISIIPTI